MKNKTCIVIVGPTAVGKTSFAIDVARHFKTEIISADSRQCYKELNIGVAKPSPLQLEHVKHYFINSHSIHHEVNAKLFEVYALRSLQEIFTRNDTAVVVGGTGLYIKAFCEGLDDIPDVEPGVREKIISSYKLNGLQWLQQELQQHDPQFFNKGEIQNPQRMMRALEVKLSTGRSVVEFHSYRKRKRDFRIVKTGLQLPRARLYENINERVDTMMDTGLLDEAKALHAYASLNALQTVGYKEIFDHLEGEISLVDAIGLIKSNTRHFAKRQITWFSRDEEIIWLDQKKAVAWRTSLLPILPGN